MRCAALLAENRRIYQRAHEAAAARLPGRVGRAGREPDFDRLYERFATCLPSRSGLTSSSCHEDFACSTRAERDKRLPSRQKLESVAALEPPFLLTYDDLYGPDVFSVRSRP